MNFANHVTFAARNGPTRPAVGDMNGLRTYEDLERETNRIANALDGLRIGAGERVGICLQNRLELITSYLGVMKSGAVPVLINAQFDSRQIKFIFETDEIRTLITDDQWADAAHAVESPVTIGGDVGLEFGHLLRESDDEFEIYPRQSNDIAEILFTSGTTGRPKRVKHTHGNLEANAQGIRKCMELTRHEVGLTVCQCFHVTGLNVTTTPLLVAEGENRLLQAWDPDSALEAIETHRVTYSFFTPAMIIDLLEHNRTEAYDLSSLERVGVGGSPMPSERVDDAEQLLGCPVLEGYGMTETTPLVAFTPATSADRKPGSVGPPAREVTDIRIEDLETGTPVTPGEHGELLWRGDTVAPRDVQSQRLKQRYVDRDGITWLRSGDIGRLDSDDNLYIVDRREDMFTSGCANVFPRRIEDVLYRIEYVTEAAVIDVADKHSGALITAIVQRSSDDLTEEQILDVCQASLDDHEIPQSVEFVDDIPRPATGKIDRVKLRDSY
jgi:long-chain acyl-CoA synthetase